MHLAHLKDYWAPEHHNTSVIDCFLRECTVHIHYSMLGSVSTRKRQKNNLSYIWNKEDSISFPMRIQNFLYFPQHSKKYMCVIHWSPNHRRKARIPDWNPSPTLLVYFHLTFCLQWSILCSEITLEVLPSWDSFQILSLLDCKPLRTEIAFQTVWSQRDIN